MDDTVAMGLDDPRGHMLGKAGSPRRRPGRAIKMLVEAAAGDVFQLEERQTLGVADVPYLDDGRMLKAGDRLGLGDKTGNFGCTGMSAREDHLECARSVQSDVAGVIDDAHSSAAELAVDVITRHRRHDASHALIRRGSRANRYTKRI